MDIDYEQIGKRIAVLRRTKGSTQAQPAEKADITNNFLSRIGRSYSTPSLETFLKICDALDRSPDAILVSVKRDSIEYLNDDISKKLLACSPKQKRFILTMIDYLQKED